MTSLHHSNNSLLAQELVLGQQTSNPDFQAKKRHYVMYEVMGPHLNLFQSYWNLAQTKSMSYLHRSNNGLLGEELVSGQQTSQY